MEDKSPIYACKISGLIWIKIIHKGWRENSLEFKDFYVEMLNEGERNFVIDLKECNMLDSTFVGTIADLALKLKDKKQKGSLTIKSLSNRNLTLLNALGINRIARLDVEDEYFSKEDDELSELLEEVTTDNKLDKDKLKNQIIHAHEKLCEIKDENRLKFMDVIKYLKKEDNKS